MRIRIEFYGMLCQLTGRDSTTLELTGSTVADALNEICRQQPNLSAQLPRIACAVGDNLVQRADTMRDGDTLALIPPVSGG